MNSKIEIQGQATNVIAGAIGAVLLSGYAGGEFLGITLPPIASWDLSDIIFLDGCTYLGACLVVSTIKYEQTIKDKIDKSPLLNRLKNGFNFLRNRPHLFWFGTASYSVFVFLLVQIHQLLPMYINNHLSEGTFTFAMSEMLYSVGALLTGITLSKLLGTMNKIQAIILLLAMAACIALWLVFTQSVLVLMIFSLLIGISNAGARILRVTYLFEHTPNELLGRTSSVFHMINVLIRFLFISLFALPFFSTDNNVIYAYLISAVFLTVSILPLYLLRKKLTT